MRVVAVLVTRAPLFNFLFRRRPRNNGMRGFERVFGCPYQPGVGGARRWGLGEGTETGQMWRTKRDTAGQEGAE